MLILFSVSDLSNKIEALCWLFGVLLQFDLYIILFCRDNCEFFLDYLGIEAEDIINISFSYIHLRVLFWHNKVYCLKYIKQNKTATINGILHSKHDFDQNHSDIHARNVLRIICFGVSQFVLNLIFENYQCETRDYKLYLRLCAVNIFDIYSFNKYALYMVQL